MLKQPSLFIVATLLASPACLADDEKPQDKTAAGLEEIVIIGDSADARALPGSGAVVDSKQLDTEVTTDIQQVLKTVPGVYIREEEGSGLRPNIGIRGATGERSSKITLLEDGIMVAPAPYSEPAAYYFPTTLRMYSIEVLKGAPLLRYGPQTTGGIINMLSTPVPETSSGSATLSTGSFGSQDLHVHYGSKQGQWSWLLETVQRDSEGFKSIDRSNRDSGFAIADYVAKAGWESVDGPQQKIRLKLQSSDEVSNETYLGLTDADFRREENRRYGLSSIDQMTNKHEGFSLLHSIAMTDIATLTTTLYRNNFQRDWFKLDGGGALVTAANGGDANAQGILDGTVDTTGLKYKHNAREYVSEGVEMNVDINLEQHLLQVGARYHEDEVDRLQPTEVYDQVNGSLVFSSLSLPGSGDNRIGQAQADTLWVQDDWQITEQLNLVMSLRYEDVNSQEKRYSNIFRTAIASQRKNNVSEWLPGVSFTYDFTENWQMLAGVHKGFSPVGSDATSNINPETSINWELGARFRQDTLFIEAISFYSDFSNKVEDCSVGTPCSNGSTSGTFETGEAAISGIETQFGAEFTANNLVIPLALAYTYTKAVSSDDNTVSAIRDGDVLKDVPENTFSARMGIEHSSGWNNYLIAKYLDETCVTIGCNRNASPQAETDDLFVLDAISRYRINNKTDVFLKAENILNRQVIISRDPDGARPNKPLSVAVGMTIDF